MVCIEPTPTVTIHLSIPEEMDSGGWAWAEHPRYPGTLAAEYAYDGRECSAVARTYGACMARLIRPSEAPRFSIVVRSWHLQIVCARQEWIWSATRHEFYAPAEPWDTSAAAIRAYWERNGQMITSQKFRSRVDGYSPGRDVRYAQAARALHLLRPDRGGATAHGSDRHARRLGGEAA